MALQDAVKGSWPQADRFTDVDVDVGLSGSVLTSGLGR